MKTLRIFVLLVAIGTIPACTTSSNPNPAETAGATSTGGNAARSSEARGVRADVSR